MNNFYYISFFCGLFCPLIKDPFIMFIMSNFFLTHSHTQPQSPTEKLPSNYLSTNPTMFDLLLYSLSWLQYLSLCFYLTYSSMTWLLMFPSFFPSASLYTLWTWMRQTFEFPLQATACSAWFSTYISQHSFK